MAKILSVKQVQKYYGNKSSLTKALDVISFDVEGGEFVAIMGASGSGKTTLLNCISTIDKVTAGHIYVAGADITGLKGKELNRFRREELGFIFAGYYGCAAEVPLSDVWRTEAESGLGQSHRHQSQAGAGG